MLLIVRARAWQGHPLLNPLDVWVWEVMVKHGHLAHALAPTQPLVSARMAPSVKDAADRAALGW